MGNLCITEKEMDNICGDLDSIECGASMPKPKTIKMARKAAKRSRKLSVITETEEAECSLTVAAIADLAGSETWAGDLKKTQRSNSVLSNCSKSTQAS